MIGKEPIPFRSNSAPPGLLSAESRFDTLEDELEDGKDGKAGEDGDAGDGGGDGDAGDAGDGHESVASAKEDEAGEEAKEVEEAPTATALEIMQSTKPEEATLEIQEALTALDSYVRGQNSEQHARNQSSAQLHAAFRVGCWTVLLSLPIIVWPWALHLQEVSTSQRESWH